MVDWPGWPHPLAFSWNAGMVLHVLKSDPALRELEHIQVNGPGLVYLFFYDRHGHHGLTKAAALAIHSHLADTFVEWIGRSAHFEVVPLLLEKGCLHVTAAQDSHRQCIWTQEQPNLPVHAAGIASSGSSLQLVGRAPPVPEGQDGGTEQEMPRASTGRPHTCPTKARPMPGGWGGSPPFSPECPGRADADDCSTASESGGGHRHQRYQQVERRLVPARLNLPMFQSTDANADVTYELWLFDVQGWLDQYDKVSMHPHIFGSLQGYPGKWAHSLPGGMNILLDELLRHMDCTFGNVCDYDSMMQSLYNICQKESETVEEYMLRVHEAVAVVKCAYLDQVPNEEEDLRQDHFYYGLIPSIRDVLSFAMADLPEREQADTSFNTLYHLAKKLEVHHQPRSTAKGGTLTHDPHKGYKYSTQRMCSYHRGRFVPIGSWAGGEHTTQTRPYRKTITEDDTSNEPLPNAGTSLFCVQGYRSLCMGLSTLWNFLHMAQGAFKNRTPTPKNNQMK